MEDNVKTPVMHITTDNKELVIRTGSAVPVNQPNKLTIEGNIDSPASYFLHHKGDVVEDEQFIDKKKSAVLVDRKKREICLIVNPKSQNGEVNLIKGKLNLSPDIAKSKVFYGEGAVELLDRKEFIKLLRFNSRYFPDKEKYNELLAKLQKLNLDFSGKANEASDNRGNSSIDREVQIKTSLPNTIDLFLRIFDGYPAARFTCEIGIQHSNGQTQFYLECPDMANVIESDTNDILDAQMKLMEGLYISITG